MDRGIGGSTYPTIHRLWRNNMIALSRMMRLVTARNGSTVSRDSCFAGRNSTIEVRGGTSGVVMSTHNRTVPMAMAMRVTR